MLQAPISGPRSSTRTGAVRREAGVRVEDAGPIRKITLDRPSRKNAITLAMYDGLCAALADSAHSEQTDVVLLGSAGGTFSVGDDTGSVAPEGSAESFAQSAADFLRVLCSFPKPIVAAVGGLAAGAGAAILLHCDVVVASQAAAFEFPALGRSAISEFGTSVLLPARVGLQRATEWLLLGERIDVDTAFRVGLVNAIVQREDLASAALARAEALARLPQATVRETKRRIREPLRAAIDAAITRELGGAPAL